MNRKYTIYCVDFDGTLCESVFPGIGSPNMALINHLIKRRKQGNKIILWTCRVGERLKEAVEWCKGYGLEFDAVNENLPEMVEYWGGESRKVFADVYIDDKAVNKPKYHVPYKESLYGEIQKYRDSVIREILKLGVSMYEIPEIKDATIRNAIQRNRDPKEVAIALLS